MIIFKSITIYFTEIFFVVIIYNNFVIFKFLNKFLSFSLEIRKPFNNYE